MYIYQKVFNRTKHIAIVLLALLLFAELSLTLTPTVAEVQRTVYYGDQEAYAVINYLEFTDVGTDSWAKEAIYETGALGILKGFRDSNGRFGRNVPITKEEAIAVAYRAAGRETEAQQLGIAINNARTQDNRKTDSLEVWYDGFLQLAANEGLITYQNLVDAFSDDQTSLTNESFRRKSAAQRQEMIYWISRTLNIQPTMQQQEVLNYTDWRSVDPDKLPYVEALLGQGIISGSNNRINPMQFITREQGAQIIKNAEEIVLQAAGNVKLSGIVENITATSDYTGSIAVTGRNISIAIANGTYASIITSTQVGAASGGKDENTGTALPGQSSELVVYKDGVIGDSSLLEKGDRVHYIADSDNIVGYVEIISNVADIRYVAVQINNVDQTNAMLDVTQLFEADYPNIKDISEDRSFSWSHTEQTTYRISSDISITINGTNAELSDLASEATAILTIDSNNLVKEIQGVDLGINTIAMRIVKGIVEENNPNLGYLTLYNEDGSGTGSSGTTVLRTYNYVDQNKTEVLRNHKSADIESIQAGDTAYLRLDSDGDIESVSAVDNYLTKYAIIISKLPAMIVVEYEDGTQQVLDIGPNIVVIKDKLLVDINALKDGDRVRMLLNENGRSTDLKEITIEGDEHFISNIYKGRITKIDSISDKVTVMGLQVFNKGRWELTETKGFTTIPLADRYEIFANDNLLTIEDANKLLSRNDAYIAVETTYGGEERAVVVSYRDSLDTEAPAISDTVSGIASGANSFVAANENTKVVFSDSSIVVKYGRLVKGNSLSDNDRAHMTLNRDFSTGDYYASVIKVDEPQNQNSLAIYRGRISDIEESRNFTVESFSQLQGVDWNYYNTPKTFNITFDTRVLNDEGVLNVRDFIGYGDESYLRRTVYIVANGTDAVLVSTAPYGTENVRGTVYAASDGQISIRRASIYNASEYMWEKCSDITVNIQANTIAVRNGSIIDPKEIRKGADIRVIKKDNSTDGDAYIIFVE